MMMGISAYPVTLNFVDGVLMKELAMKGTIAVARRAGSPAGLRGRRRPHLQ
jgi:hypothetical protein